MLLSSLSWPSVDIITGTPVWIFTACVLPRSSISPYTLPLDGMGNVTFVSTSMVSLTYSVKVHCLPRFEGGLSMIPTQSPGQSSLCADIELLAAIDIAEVISESGEPQMDTHTGVRRSLSSTQKVLRRPQH
eukprot:GEMP01049560.1.p1 GENE.GEMP01049560.1~~GEMP01049560.1.p1  ORF type:complete len:131 (-),score=17.17 GEMP01049560.1:83-475(-)